MATRVFSVVLLLVLTVLLSEAPADEFITRWASGEVVATDTTAVPNTIVLRTKNWKGLEFIVGAAIDESTVIRINNKPATLKDVRVGDHADIVYVRNTRVIAKKINIKR